MPDGPRDEVRAAQRGDRQAAETLARRLLPRVRNLVRYLVRGDDEVDDITQIALTAVLVGIGSYRGDAPFERWADRVVARKTFEHLRRSRLRAAREAPRAEPPEPSVGPERFEDRRRLARALDALPEVQREAVVLHHVAGFTLPELASLLDVPRDTAKSRLRLGMARLRTALRGEEAAS